MESESVLLNRCMQARRAKDFQGTLKAARSALALSPSNAKAWAYSCWALFNLQRYDDAIRECKSAIRQQPWSYREREGMANLMLACSMLKSMDLHRGPSSPGELLRNGWYAGSLRRRIATDESKDGSDDVERRLHSLGPKILGPAELVNRYAAQGHHVDTGWVGRRIPSGTLQGFPLDQCMQGMLFLRQQVLSVASLDGGWYNHQLDGPGARLPRSPNPLQPICDFPQWQVQGVEALQRAQHHVTHTVRHQLWHSATIPPLDVFYANNVVPAATHARLQARLDELAKQRHDSPIPMYHNIIDPNLGSVDGVWVPTDFLVSECVTTKLDVLSNLQLAAKRCLGRLLPPHIARDIVLMSHASLSRAKAQIIGGIPDLDPQTHFRLYLVLQQVLEAALPMLAGLTQPALLLPGPLQAVVKAQRIVLSSGQKYEGVWHEDGLREAIVAVVLYYYRCSPDLDGGSLEFCSKSTEPVENYEFQEGELRSWIRDGLPHCQVPVEEGTMIVFSNYAAVHRVLPLIATGNGSRDFVAFFVVDQRQPLPCPPLPDLEHRRKLRPRLLKEQLEPRGRFGASNELVHGTGNASIYDVGWIRDMNAEDEFGGAGLDPGSDSGRWSGAGYEVAKARSLLEGVTRAPPVLHRGMSYALSLPPVRGYYKRNDSSSWEGCCVTVGDDTQDLYVHLQQLRYTTNIPDDGVSCSHEFDSVEAWMAHALQQGLWTDDAAILHGPLDVTIH